MTDTPAFLDDLDCVVSDLPLDSVSSNLVFAVLARKPAYHGCYLVWRALECLAGTTLAPTNARLVEMTGLGERYVRTAISVMAQCGLLTRVYSLASSHRSLRLIVDHDILGKLETNQIAINFKKRKVYQTDTGAQIQRAAGTQVVSECPAMREVDAGTEPVDVTSSAIFSYVEMLFKGTLNSDYTQEQTTPESQIHGRPKLVVTDDMRTVFEAWALHTNSPLKKLPPGSRMASKIRSSLTDFAVDDLVAMVEWASHDPWLSGNHPQNTRAYLTIETLFRSKGKTAGYVHNAKRWIKQGRPGLARYDRRATHLDPNDAPQGEDEQF